VSISGDIVQLGHTVRQLESLLVDDGIFFFVAKQCNLVGFFIFFDICALQVMTVPLTE
jgi:hypothetical protein